MGVAIKELSTSLEEKNIIIQEKDQEILELRRANEQLIQQQSHFCRNSGAPDELESVKVQLDLERQDHARTIVTNRRKFEKLRQDLTKEKAEKARRNLQIKMLQDAVNKEQEGARRQRSRSIDELEEDL